MHFNTIKKAAFLILTITCLSAGKAYSQIELSTDYLKIRIDKRGYITSLKNSKKVPYREFSPANKPSPLLCLYNSSKQTYYMPQKAVYTKSTQTFALFYANGSVATVKLETKAKYFKLTLQSLTNRKDVDVIQWAVLHTTINNLLGEIIGVARDTSAAVNYAIGMLALNDNTLGGIAETIADAAPFQYIIHTPDVKRFPLPDSLNSTSCIDHAWHNKQH